MGRRVLITGGAGFIGSHLADRLLAAGDRVRVLDSLVPQVHGEGGARPPYLNPDVDLEVGDVRDPVAVLGALEGVDAVVHLAAAVGVGQSMYRMAHYAHTNTVGTAVLLEALAQRPVARLVVSSSMSVYGEGLYRAQDGTLHDDVARSPAQLALGQWEPTDAQGCPLTPLPTPESKPPSLASVYALTKYDQERLCLIAGEAQGIATTALRLFNVYGTRQALSNPYTGVLAIFASRLLNNNPPLVYEDGQQRRDLVSVHDVAEAFYLALGDPEAAGRALNIGSGVAHTVGEVADLLARALGRHWIGPVVTGTYRVGDIRHCYADVRLAGEVLGYRPRHTLEGDLPALAEWIAAQPAVDRVEEAQRELAAHQLTLGRSETR